ncbi:PEP-CTERM sorting domain-containing protein [Roseateles sp. P5_D6]
MKAETRRLVPRLPLLMGTLFALALAPATTHAVVVIDQPQSMGFGVMYPFMPGQTFTAVGTRIDTIGVELRNMNKSRPGSLVSLSLYEGEGSGGTLLASSSVDVRALLGDTGGAALVDFNLGAVKLQPGQTYSFQLTASDERFGVSYYSVLGEDAYPGGHMFNAFESEPLGDLTFNVTAVPEPGIAALLLIGGGWLAGVRLRAGRRR